MNQQSSSQPGKPAKRVSLGSPINWSDSDLAVLANISPADLTNAQALWQQEAPKPFKALLQAEVLEQGEQ